MTLKRLVAPTLLVLGLGLGVATNASADYRGHRFYGHRPVVVGHYYGHRWYGPSPYFYGAAYGPACYSGYYPGPAYYPGPVAYGYAPSVAVGVGFGFGHGYRGYYHGPYRFRR